MKALRIIATVVLVIGIIAGSLAFEIMLFTRLTVLNPAFYRVWLRDQGLYEVVYDTVLDSLADSVSEDSAEDMTDILIDTLEDVLPQDDFEDLCSDYLNTMMRYLNGRSVRADFDFDQIIWDTIEAMVPRMTEQALEANGGDLAIGRLEGVLTDNDLTVKELFALSDEELADLFGVSTEEVGALRLDETDMLSQSTTGELLKQTQKIPFSTNWSPEAEDEFDDSTREVRRILRTLDDAFTILWAALAMAVVLLFVIWIPVMRPAFVVSGILLIINGVMTILTGGGLFIAGRVFDWSMDFDLPASTADLTRFITDVIMGSAGKWLMIIGGTVLVLGIIMLILAGIIGKNQRNKQTVSPLPMVANP